MDLDDARYERPCRWLLAVAAGMHWVTAAVMLTEHLRAGNEVLVGETIASVLRALIQSLS